MKKAVLFLLVLVLACQAYASSDYGTVDIHGFISQGFLISDDHDYFSADTDKGTFEFNEAGINFTTELTDSLRLGMQLFAKDLGELGNDEITIDWAYADWQYRNWLGVRVGKIKKPAGLYNQSRDIDVTRTSIFLPTGIYNETLRESSLANKGIGIYGTLPGGFEYYLLHGIFIMTPDGGAAKLLENLIERKIGSPIEVLSVEVEDNPTAELIWRTPLEGLRLSANTTKHKFIQNTTIGDLETKGYMCYGSIEYVFGECFLSSEYRLGYNDISLGESQMADTYREEYFFMGSYRFSEWFELGLYYSLSYDNRDDKDGKKEMTKGDASLYEYREEAYLKDLALSLRFDINDNWILKLEGHKFNGLQNVDFTDSDDPTNPDPDWFLYAAKVSYSF